MEHLEDGELCPALPKPSALARRGNRARQKLRPTDSTTLVFDLDFTYISRQFFRADISVENRRHILFATEEQLSMLKRAKTWYADATFKVVKLPFTQLFTIHAFIR